MRIGVNMPLTGGSAGWAGAFGNGFAMGIDDCVREYKLDPAIFVVDTQDNASRADQAAAVLDRHRSQTLDAYVSVAVGAALAPPLDAMGIPHFLETFDSFVTRRSPTRFRVMAHLQGEADLVLQYAAQRNARHVHILSIDAAAANEMVETYIVAPLQERGVRATVERFGLAQQDFSAIAERTKAENPDVIFVETFSSQLKPLIGELRTRGLVGPGRVIAPIDFVDVVRANPPPEELQNVVFIAPLFDIPGQARRAHEWRGRYQRRFNTSPTFLPAFAYDTATLIARAYARTRALNAEGLIAAGTFEGVSGAVALDSDRDLRVAGALVTTNANGRIVPLPASLPAQES